MAHVITQSCCNDTRCVAVCPVNCIHPGPDEPGHATAEMVYIDGEVCIDCGACVDVCPVDAIVPDDELAPADLPYIDLSALHFRTHEYEERPLPSALVRSEAAGQRLRVAVIGSGPSASYAVETLLDRRDVLVEVNVFEKLLTPGGLVRFGVAPDHLRTKQIAHTFERTMGRAGCSVFLGVEVGTHLSHEELLAHHDAVVYATGAADDRRLGVPGEYLSGSVAATDLVAWYNGHPDFSDLAVDLGCERAVVVGNGNVALDVARVLTSHVDDLRASDIAEHALDALASSAIHEVVVVGRRGPAQAAYTTPELLGLGHTDGVDVVVDPQEAQLDPVTKAWLDGGNDPMARAKAEVAFDYARSPARSGRRSIRLRYLAAPEELIGGDKVTGIRLRRTRPVASETGAPTVLPGDCTFDIACGLVIRSIGYRARPIPALPVDPTTGVVLNDRGRVLDPVSGAAVRAVYVTGWAKRGASGVIGTNRSCAEETVDSLIEDLVAGRLTPASRDQDDLVHLIRDRQPDYLQLADWRSIDRYERELGGRVARPRVKLVDRVRQLAAVRAE